MTNMKVSEILPYYRVSGHARNYLNHSSSHLPYHNAFHTGCMVELCYKGATYYNLSYDATKQLLLAAIYHDYGHSGGANPDSENIKAAQQGVLYFVGESIISEFIACTEYPFIIAPRTIEERILRDADMLQISCDNWEDMIIHGLQKEVVVTTPTVTENDMWAGQAKFHKAPEFFTDWGKSIYNSSLVMDRRQIIFQRASEIESLTNT